MCRAAVSASLAKLKPGDVVVKVGSAEVTTFAEMVAAVQKANGPTPFVVQRTTDGVTSTVDTVVDVSTTKRWVPPTGGGEATGPSDVGAIGVTAAQFGPTQHNPLVPPKRRHLPARREDLLLRDGQLRRPPPTCTAITTPNGALLTSNPSGAPDLLLADLDLTQASGQFTEREPSRQPGTLHRRRAAVSA
jgi:hypothetical protein